MTMLKGKGCDSVLQYQASRQAAEVVSSNRELIRLMAAKLEVSEQDLRRLIEDLVFAGAKAFEDHFRKELGR